MNEINPTHIVYYFKIKYFLIFHLLSRSASPLQKPNSGSFGGLWSMSNNLYNCLGFNRPEDRTCKSCGPTYDHSSRELLTYPDSSDVTLAQKDDWQYEAHRVMLSAFSTSPRRWWWRSLPTPTMVRYASCSRPSPWCGRLGEDQPPPPHIWILEVLRTSEPPMRGVAGGRVEEYPLYCRMSATNRLCICCKETPLTASRVCIGVTEK